MIYIFNLICVVYRRNCKERKGGHDEREAMILKRLNWHGEIKKAAKKSLT